MAHDRRTGRLPQSWNTKQDGSGVNTVSRRVTKLLGPPPNGGAMVMFDVPKPDGGFTSRWFLVRFLDRVPPDWGGNPGSRHFEVLAVGDSINELEWCLNRIESGGRVTAYAPVLEKGVGMVALRSQSGSLIYPVSVAEGPADA